MESNVYLHKGGVCQIFIGFKHLTGWTALFSLCQKDGWGSRFPGIKRRLKKMIFSLTAIILLWLRPLFWGINQKWVKGRPDPCNSNFTVPFYVRLSPKDTINWGKLPYRYQILWSIIWQKVWWDFGKSQDAPWLFGGLKAQWDRRYLINKKGDWTKVVNQLFCIQITDKIKRITIGK